MGGECCGGDALRTTTLEGATRERRQAQVTAHNPVLVPCCQARLSPMPLCWPSMALVCRRREGALQGSAGGGPLASGQQRRQRWGSLLRSPCRWLHPQSACRAVLMFVCPCHRRCTRVMLQPQHLCVLLPRVRRAMAQHIPYH